MAAAPQKYLSSFGRRRGRRLRTQSQQAFDESAQFYLSVPETGQVPLAEVFSGKPVWMEVGFGGGEHLAHQAALHPEVGFIGCEPFVNGIASLVKHIGKKKLSNIRIYPDDARHVLERLPDTGIDRIFILYPDPWPKSRHHKRRIISQDTIQQLARVMKRGGELLLASDHADYVSWMLQHMLASDAFCWKAKSQPEWENPPSDWLSTRYEQKALREGRCPTYLLFSRL